MSVAKRTVLLLLVAAAVGINADDDCVSLNKTLPRSELDKIFGDWVLVWSVADNDGNTALLANLSSSFVELHLDGDVIEFNERNLFHDKSCTKYFMNTTMPSNTSEEYELETHGGFYEKDGVRTVLNETGSIEFYETVENCLVMGYKGTEGHYLLAYRREGHHQDAEQLKAAHEHHQKRAECLGFPVDKPFAYDGAADFCPKASGSEAEQS